LNFEEHKVATEDGHILTVYHVWKVKNGPVVFFQHGLFSHADTWIANKKKSPAYQAAMAGYDVWLGNNRGTKHSRDHKVLDP
jgi:pimeloyl-ACP methyl ester carboxylesterase